MTDRLPATDEGLLRAAAILRDGGLVAFPTDTVYGIGCRADDAGALARLFAAKRRPPDKAIPWLVTMADQAAAAGYLITDPAALLIRRFWPGPLTVVLPSAAGGATQAFRAPLHPVALPLLALAGPLATSSANRSDEPETYDADDVAIAFADAAPDELDAILDGGRVPGGVASSVIDVSGERPRLLREAAVSRARLEEVIGPID
jgi:L-threonylcarbamoyladenylate synthase